MTSRKTEIAIHLILEGQKGNRFFMCWRYQHDTSRLRDYFGSASILPLQRFGEGGEGKDKRCAMRDMAWFGVRRRFSCLSKTLG